MTFYDGPKRLDEVPKCILQMGAGIVGAEMVGAEVSENQMKGLDM